MYTAETPVQLNYKKIGKRWQARAYYYVDNPEYIEKPAGDAADTRDTKERKRRLRKYITKTLTEDIKTKAQATKASAEWVEELEHAAQFTESSDILIPDYADTITEIYRDKIEASTHEGYLQLNKYFRSEFSNIKLHDLTHKDIDEWVYEQKRTGWSTSTISKRFTRLKTIYKYAVRRGDIEKSPFDRADNPKAAGSNPNPLTDEAYKRFNSYLELIEDTPFKLAYVLALHCGLRRQEICSLQWRDVDFKNRVLDISKAIGAAKGAKATYIKSPKSKSSKREIALSDYVIEILNRYYTRLQVDIAMAGLDLTPEQLSTYYLIGNIDGDYMLPDRLSKDYAGLAKSLNLVGTKNKLTTFHDLRHTFATVAVASNVDIKSVASYLGHANAAITLNIYADADPEAKRAAADTVSQAYINKR